MRDIGVIYQPPASNLLCPALNIAVKMAIGFCVNARQNWKDWEDHEEVGLLLGRLTLASQDPAKFLAKYGEDWKGL